MNGRVTIDAGADVKQSEDVNLTTIQNENISAAVTRLEGNGGNRFIDRIQQLGTIKKCK